MGEVILESFLHSLKMLPFLFMVYVLIELVEEKTTYNFHKNKLLKGWWAPTIGASVGIIPQCGFSVIAANLFTQKKLTIGALIAVFIATSDEAVPILISNPSTIKMLFPLLLTKFVFALFLGYLADFIVMLINKRKYKLNALNKETSINDNSIIDMQKQLGAESICYKNCEMEIEDNNTFKEHAEHSEIGCCGHHLDEKHKNSAVQKFLMHPLIHSLKIFTYIFIMNLLLNILIFYITKERIVGFLTSNIIIGPMLSSIVGLIPNCFSSVVITELFAMGALDFGSCIAGLSVNAGLGFLILFKENKNIKQNVAVVVGLFVASIVFGLILNLIV